MAASGGQPKCAKKDGDGSIRRTTARAPSPSTYSIGSRMYTTQARWFVRANSRAEAYTDAPNFAASLIGVFISNLQSAASLAYVFPWNRVNRAKLLASRSNRSAI